MRRYIPLIFISIIILTGLNCGSPKSTAGVSPEESDIFEVQKTDTIAITDEASNYDIVIIEPGFQTWLQSVARPEGYYSQSFLENRNQIFVTNWNQRVLLPLQYDPLLYEIQINYDPSVDYGYDVNYKLYNYFIYFQRKYKQQLGPFLPRI